MLDQDVASELEIAIDRLYQAPLGEFVAARGRLASALKTRDRAAAARVAKLAKPSVTAWAVNQAYWRAPAEFEKLLDAGERIRALQRGALEGKPGGDMQDATAARLHCVARLLVHAERALREADHAATPGVLRRITTTLEALAAYGRASSAPAAGRLTADVPAPGFAALAALAGELPAPSRPSASTAGGAASGAVDPAAAPLATSAPARPRLAPASDGPADGAGLAGPRLARTGPATANDNASDRAGSDGRAHRNRAAAVIEAQKARRAARAAVADAEAEVAERQRRLRGAEQDEQAALERLYRAEQQVALAQEALATAIGERSAAVAAAEQAKAAAARARDTIAEAQEALRAAKARLDDAP